MYKTGCIFVRENPTHICDIFITRKWVNKLEDDRMCYQSNALYFDEEINDRHGIVDVHYGYVTFI